MQIQSVATSRSCKAVPFITDPVLSFALSIPYPFSATVCLCLSCFFVPVFWSLFPPQYTPEVGYIFLTYLVHATMYRILCLCRHILYLLSDGFLPYLSERSLPSGTRTDFHCQHVLKVEVSESVMVWSCAVFPLAVYQPCGYLKQLPHQPHRQQHQPQPSCRFYAQASSTSASEHIRSPHDHVCRPAVYRKIYRLNIAIKSQA